MRFFTAGESHGPALTVIMDDFPAGVAVSTEIINRQLSQRQQGYGRSIRQKIETDQVQILGGIRHGTTTGAPISLLIENKDHANWSSIMSPMPLKHTDGPDVNAPRAFTRPRPGHADLAGYYKYNHLDLRDVLERASARETAARVATGAVARCLLEALEIRLTSHVTAMGGIRVSETDLPEDWETLAARTGNDLRCAGSEATLSAMKKRIDEAQQAGTTLGGEFEVIAWNVPPGLGSYAQWDRRLDGLLAQAVMSIQAVKAVSIGDALQGSEVEGHHFHDTIIPTALPDSNAPSMDRLSQSPTPLAQPKALTRPTNRAGGLEGGVTNGMPLIIRGVMKPISTMRVPLDSVDLATGEPEAAHFERSDVTAVPACAVIAEAMVAIVLCQAILDKFGHDCLSDILAAYQAYKSRLRPLPV